MRLTSSMEHLTNSFERHEIARPCASRYFGVEVGRSESKKMDSMPLNALGLAKENRVADVASSDRTAKRWVGSTIVAPCDSKSRM